MSRIQHLAINDEGFIFDPSTGESFTVNPTGLIILNNLRENKSEAEIVSILKEEFEISGEDVERDVSDFFRQIRAMRLI